MPEDSVDLDRMLDMSTWHARPGTAGRHAARHGSGQRRHVARFAELAAWGTTAAHAKSEDDP